MIEWRPGTDAKGKVQLAGGKPAFARSKCGRYTIARAYMQLSEGSSEYVWLCEVWHITDGVAMNLKSRLQSADAKRLAEEHSNGLAGNGL